MRRILFMHSRASRRGGRAAAHRLNVQDWSLECEAWWQLSKPALSKLVISKQHLT